METAWNKLDVVFGGAEATFTPITYVNSSAALKAFCGRHGGIVCTSGNAENVMRWALAKRPRLFFFPDQHLGRNTARGLGISLEEMLLWDVYRSPETEALREAKVVLWPGSCNVHQRFRPEHVAAVRERFPGIRVLVHPECRMEVVDLADAAGSTAFIITQIREAAAGSQWAVGTEARLVQRLQAEHPEQTIVSLADVAPFCRTMSQLTLENLAQVLEGLERGEFINEIAMDPAGVSGLNAETAHRAGLALERMLEVAR